MLLPDPDHLLRERFQLDAFRPGQRQVIDTLLAGRSALALFPTGGGKSLCYQLPALAIEGVTLVISPLIALMKDQVDALQSRGIAAARLDSTLAAEDEAVIHRAMRRGGVDLVYVAPERLANEGFRRVLEATPLALVAIDEAHCISEWGHNFRPDYLKLAALCRRLKVPRVLCLTATATPAVAADIRAGFGIAAADQVETSHRRANLHFAVTPCRATERTARLVERLREGPGAAGAVIVYTTLQRGAEKVAHDLRAAGLDARAYHAGMRPEAREEVQEAFMTGSLRIVVATIAFGMGIDKADVRAVFHFNLPKSLENYVQESGRAGRDGAPAHCEILACGDDLTTLENFIWGNTPSPGALRALLDSVLRAGEVFDHSRYELSVALDLKPPVLATALAWLETKGIIELIGPFYAGCRLRFVRSRADALAGYNEDRRRFLERLFDAAKAGRTWLTYEDLEAIAARLGEDPRRIRKALDYLAGLGEVVLAPSGLRHRYRRLHETSSTSSLLPALIETFKQRERADLERLAQVVAWCEEPGCLVRRMLAHFGQDAEECGSCGNCVSSKMETVALPHRRPEALEPSEVELIHELAAEHHAALRQPRQLARFLAGIGGPTAARSGLTRNDRFGALEKVPFPLILAQADELL